MAAAALATTVQVTDETQGLKGPVTITSAGGSTTSILGGPAWTWQRKKEKHKFGVAFKSLSEIDASVSHCGRTGMPCGRHALLRDLDTFAVSTCRETRWSVIA
jgi:hypothetical protein